MKYINYIVIFLVVTLVFGNTVFNDYNLDDELVTKNNRLTSNSQNNSLLKIFTSPYQSEGGLSSGYRPITLASFYIEHQLFGESAKVSHAINLIFYALLILLIYHFLICIFKETNSYILLFICLLFAIHPIHSEVVASIKNRDEILSLLFFINAALFSIKWIGKRNLLFLCATIFFISLAILSKKSTIPLIVIYPFFLLIKEKLNRSNFLQLSICFSIPISLFTFNFQLFPGLLLFIGFYGFYFGYCVISYYFTKSENHNPTTFEIIFLLSSILFVSIGCYYHDFLFFLIGLFFLTALFKNYFKEGIMLSIGFSIIGFFVFDQTEFLIYSLIIISTVVIKRSKKLKFKLIYLLPLFLVSFLIAYEKENWLALLIYLIPLLIICSAFIYKSLPLIISLISLVISFLFFSVTSFNVGILLSSFAVSQIITATQSNKFLVAIWLISTGGFIIQKQEIKNNSIFSSQKSLGQQESIEKVNNTNLEEGRKLEFVENTLIAPHSLNERLATGTIVLNEYFRLLVFPKELSFYYGFSKINTTNFSNYWVWIGLVVHALLLFLGIYYLKKEPLIAIGALWYLSSIFIFSNHTVLIAGMVGERLAFCASLGFCIMIGGFLKGIQPNFSFKKIRLAEGLSLLLLLTFSIRTFSRNSKWESAEKLMSNDIEHLQNSAQANYLLGVHSIKNNLKHYQATPQNRKKINYSINYFKRAIQIYPNYYNYHIDLGRAYLVLGENELAKASFLAADNLEPNAFIGLFELAKVSFTIEEYEDAIEYAQFYLKQIKTNPTVYEVAAFSAYYLNNYSLAIQFTEEGLKSFPNNLTLKELLEDLKKRN